jgi:hypothetical protein
MQDFHFCGVYVYINTFFSQIGCECEDVFDSLAELMHWPFVHVLLIGS